MRQPLSDSDESGKPEFQKIVDEFLLQPGLPFATVVTAEKIERIFRKHGGLFGENGIFSTAIVLWAFLGQVLRDRKEASCQAAVERKIVRKIVPVTLQRKLRFLCCFGEVAGVWFRALDAGELCDATGESAGDFCGR